MNASKDVKLECLCEIARLALERSNQSNVSAAESFTLGQIIGTAARIPGVMQDLHDREVWERGERGAGFSRSWPPGVKGEKQGGEDSA